MIHTFPVSGPLSLDCRTGFGTVTVHADEPVEQARVELVAVDSSSGVAEGAEVRLLEANALSIRAPKPRWSLFDIPFLGTKFAQRDAMNIDIVVPPGTPMRIAAWGGSVIVTGRAGALDVMSGCAAIEAPEIDGELRLRFGSGSAEVRRVRGTATVRSGGGRARIGEVDGAVTMVCGSGSLELGVARGPVRVRSGSGGATIGEAHGDVEMASGSGALCVGLPAGQPARLDIVTGSGRLDSQLPVEDVAPIGEAITIRARTGSGNISIRRAPGD
ncbi:MAG: hypothetical protein LBQ06_02035 [Frankiaceae bacterium]|jgi:hypothetical protein|nr:hypothetical protein [Frankiaceae bacterium]